jgi:hypothetical protein
MLYANKVLAGVAVSLALVKIALGLLKEWQCSRVAHVCTVDLWYACPQEDGFFTRHSQPRVLAGVQPFSVWLVEYRLAARRSHHFFFPFGCSSLTCPHIPSGVSDLMQGFSLTAHIKTTACLVRTFWK